MKIYTKTGDKGETSLLGGIRVPKNHVRIEAYGTIDELNSWIGLLKCQDIDEWTIGALNEIQDRLFTIGSHLAVGKADIKMKLPELFEKDIESLEMGIDKMNEKLEPMR
ncbi:MAG TPA: ATP:cob(I)alamin adenosyltransferase, partial [Bacteroidia bacterium]|nr:ATP:cob(I)alamin adenosyltransferase [Bacteroidia bacterium]